MGFLSTTQKTDDQRSGDGSSHEENRGLNLARISDLLGRKQNAPEEAHIPAADMTAAVDRVLRKTPAPTQTTTESINDEPIRATLGAIEAALYSIDQIREIIEQAYDVALSARDVEDAGGRSLLAESYDELRLSINSLVDDLDEQASVLIGKNQRHIDVHLGGKAHYSISPTRLDVSSKGLNLDPPRDAFATFDEITQIMDELDAATKRADRAAASYCRDAQYLITRLNGVDQEQNSQE